MPVIVVAMDGTRKRLSSTKTTLAGSVRFRAKCQNDTNTITFGDQFNDEDQLHDGDAAVMEHPFGVDISQWYATGVVGDEMHIIHGGGF